MTVRLQHALQHRLNAIQVYCRLCSFLPRGVAIRISRAWERVVHPLIYGKGNSVA